MEYFTLTHLTHSCEMCISKFLSRRLLESHKLKVHRLKPKVTEVYNCDLCLTAFKKNELYKKHLDLSHKTEREMLREGRLRLLLLLWLTAPAYLGSTLDRDGRQFSESDPFVIGVSPELSDK